MPARDPGPVTALLDDGAAIVRTATERYLAGAPHVTRRCGIDARAACEAILSDHLNHLVAAIVAGQPRLFDEHVSWAAIATRARELDLDDLHAELSALVDTIAARATPERTAEVAAAVRASLAMVELDALEPATFVDGTRPHGTLAVAVLEALLVGDHRAVSHLVIDASDAGAPIESLYLDVLQPCRREVGRLWQLGRVSVAHEHAATAAVQVTMARLSRRMLGAPRSGLRVLVLAVEGERHDLGARMVADLFELHGWDSHFLGADVPLAAIGGIASERAWDLVAVSVTTLANVVAVRPVLAALRAASAAPVLVGGRPFEMVPDLWRRLGADATAADARDAVAVATSLVGAA